MAKRSKRKQALGINVVEADVPNADPLEKPSSMQNYSFILALLSLLPWIFGVNLRFLVLAYPFPQAWIEPFNAGLWVCLFAGLPCAVLALVWSRHAKRKLIRAGRMIAWVGASVDIFFTLVSVIVLLAF